MDLADPESVTIKTEPRTQGGDGDEMPGSDVNMDCEAVKKESLDDSGNIEGMADQVHDEKTALRFLQHRQIIQNERFCLRGHQMHIKFKGNHIFWACSKRTCRTHTSVRQNTWLENSKYPLKTIVYFIYWWSLESTSVKFCKVNLGMTIGAVVNWNNYMREVCVWKMKQISSHGKKIGGPDKMVEIDESLFIKRKNVCGKILPQMWIFGGICRETKECFVVNVPDRSAVTLLPIIFQYVEPGSTIMSDCWKAFDELKHMEYHKFNFVDPETVANTQMERICGSVKWGNKKRRGTDRNFVDSYLAEFMWRTNLNGREPFDVILEDIASFYLALHGNSIYQ